LKAIVGFFLTTMGGFVAALNLATMFPNPEYAASWGKVFFALTLSIFGGMLLYKSNSRPHAEARSADSVQADVGNDLGQGTHKSQPADLPLLSGAIGAGGAVDIQRTTAAPLPVSNDKLLACLIYHEGKAEVAEVYGRLHLEEDCRREWQETRNRHLRFVRALKQANAVGEVRRNAVTSTGLLADESKGEWT